MADDLKMLISLKNTNLSGVDPNDKIHLAANSCKPTPGAVSQKQIVLAQLFAHELPRVCLAFTLLFSHFLVRIAIPRRLTRRRSDERKRRLLCH